MIITKLVGGLGNQMFQYAAGLSLALKHDTKLLLDISEFAIYKLRIFGLNHFDIRAGIADDQDIKKFLQKTKFARILEKATLQKFEVYNEPAFKYNPQINNLGKNVYLNGYWQSPIYFDEFAAAITKDFSVKDPPSATDSKMLKLIGETNSVSIHIRRGDYVSNKETNSVHGTCTPEYYRKCIELIAKRVKNPVFFVFSDDYAWVKENIKIEYPKYYMEHNSAAQDYQDMRLLYNCKHSIIANSSLSWWGAWLNRNANKVVLAPKNWFNNAEHDTSTLLPESWMKI